MIDKILEKVRKRDEDSHKYDFGHLLVIGGSKLYSGSPALNSLAAYRSGVDLVTVVAPKRSADVIATFSPSMITYPLEGDYLEKGHLDELESLKERASAVVIGGGLGRNEETMKAVRSFLKNFKAPTVIDADGIKAVAEGKNLLRKEFVLTPHAAEFQTLTGKKVEKDLGKRKKQVRNFAKKHNCTVVLKGATDLISAGGEVYENDTGNEYMTVGGTGDTLAGIVGSLQAQRFSPLQAARGGAWINGRAGELASEKGGVGLTPDDLLEKIPEVIEEG